MFHICFNTFFITKKEKRQIANGSSSHSGTHTQTVATSSPNYSLPAKYIQQYVTHHNTPPSMPGYHHHPRQQDTVALISKTPLTPLSSHQDQYYSSSHHAHLHSEPSATHPPPPPMPYIYRTLSLPKMELDKANKDKTHFSDHFIVSIHITKS